MRCPHCAESFHEQWTLTQLPYAWTARSTTCPACGGMIIQAGGAGAHMLVSNWRWVEPRAPARVPLPESVPKEIVDDYREAEAVLTVSAKSSAALSRRLLQRLLRDYGGATQRDLASQIDHVLPGLPSHIAGALDSVRSLGNFAAHPLKSQSTGEVVAVEAGEAEWTLETVAALIDFYIVAPAALMARRDALNAKLADAGKPPMRGGDATDS